MNLLLLMVPVFLGVLASLAWLGLRYFVSVPVTTVAAASAVRSSGLSRWCSALRERAYPLKNRRWIGKGKRLLRRDMLLVYLSPLLIFAVIALTLQLRAYYRVPGAQPLALNGNSQIAQVLTEDTLVPPPSLPPSAFTDVIAERPTLKSANRDWNGLEPSFAQTVLLVMSRMKQRGYQTMLLEGCRSPSRQALLANGATLVTKAGPGKSKHQYGYAADIAFVRNGRVVISEKDQWAMQGYLDLGEEATRAGLVWGGNWSFRDYGHIEQTGSIKSLMQLMNKEGRRCV